MSRQQVLFKRLNAGPGVPAVLDPGNLPFMELRLDATSIAQADNTPVALWPDTSGQIPPRGAFQPVGARQPIYGAPGGFAPNGLPMVYLSRFNDTHIGGVLPIPPVGVDSTQGQTFYWVGRLFEIKAGGGSILWSSPGAGAEPRLQWQSQAAPFWAGWRDTAPGLEEKNIWDPAIGGLGFYHLTWVFEPPSTVGEGTLYVDGDSKGSAVWVMGNANSDYRVNGIGAVTEVEHTLAEFIWFSRPHSPATVRAVRRFLSNKWGF